MQTLLPSKLKIKEGDTIGFLSCSGDIKDFSRLEKAKNYFENLGYNVKISDTSKTRNDYLCATDELRAKALNDFFADPCIDVIIASRGGYGAIRILDMIDYEIVKNNPKIFAGYSDITALSLMILKRTGLVTYNAPMAYSDFGGEKVDSYSEKSFFEMLKNDVNEIVIDNPEIFYQGSASGILWGGNLSTIQSMCGLDFIPDEKFIFVAEDVNEPVYKIDRMFTQLLNIKQFKQNLSGIVLGDFTGIDNEIYFKNYLTRLADSMKIPLIRGLKFGHEKEKQTFPLGVKVILDTNISKLLIK